MGLEAIHRTNQTRPGLTRPVDPTLTFQLEVLAFH